GDSPTASTGIEDSSGWQRMMLSAPTRERENGSGRWCGGCGAVGRAWRTTLEVNVHAPVRLRPETIGRGRRTGRVRDGPQVRVGHCQTVAGGAAVPNALICSHVHDRFGVGARPLL